MSEPATAKDLIEAFTASAVFRKMRNQVITRKLLSYLAEHSTSDEHHLRTEAALLKLPFLHNRPLARMSTMLGRLQDALDEYFESNEGRHHRHRLRILRGSELSPRSPRHNAIESVPNDAGEPFTRSFWWPYIAPGAPATHIAYGLPMFSRDAAYDRFTRDINKKNATEIEEAGEVVCWPFVTLGDILCVIELTKWLGDRNVRVTSHGYKPDRGADDMLARCAEQDNVIVVGSSRVSRILSEYQRPSSLPFRVRLTDVVEGGDSTTEEKPYPEERHGAESMVPVVVTRRTGRRGGKVTMIAANHGRAVHRAGEILQTEELLKKIFTDSRLAGWTEAMPSQFQLLLNVEVQDDESFAGYYHLLRVWREGSRPC